MLLCVGMEESPLPNSNDTSWQYCVIIICGVEDEWITFRSFCYSALTASGPLLLSPPSLLTFAHTLVSGIMCVIYASRNFLLQAVLKFTYGNLVTHIATPLLVFCYLITYLLPASLFLIVNIRNVVWLLLFSKFILNPKFKQLLHLQYLHCELLSNACRSHFNTIPTSKLNINQNTDFCRCLPTEW
jgi:hypothetical protein